MQLGSPVILWNCPVRTEIVAGLCASLLVGCGAAPVDPETDRPQRVDDRATEELAQPPPAARGSGARDQEQAYGPLVIPRAVLDRTIAAGPGAFLAQVPLQPERGTDKKFQGFRIVSLYGDSPRVLRYGVLPGDLLISCQGQRIVTPGDLLTVFQRLRRIDVVEVQVKRAGELKVLRWPVVPALAPQAEP